MQTADQGTVGMHLLCCQTPGDARLTHVLLSGLNPSAGACLQTDDQWKEAMKFLETLGSKELTDSKTEELEEAAGAEFDNHM